jgi:maltose phosphorylase
MKNYLKHDPWKIIEDTFHPAYQRVSESVFSLGNGRFGGRGNFEEGYGGDTLVGNYVGGVYYPDKTRVGWWKNGYPEYFAKVLNAPNWLPIQIAVDGQKVDLATADILEFERVLDMQKGVLDRKVQLKTPNGAEFQFSWRRFISMHHDEIALITCDLQVIEAKGKLEIDGFIDGDVRNEDANYDEMFWESLGMINGIDHAMIKMRTRKTGFVVTTGQRLSIRHNKKYVERESYQSPKLKVGSKATLNINSGDTIKIVKYVSLVSSLMHQEQEQQSTVKKNLDEAYALGIDQLQENHFASWREKWNWSDVSIEGDVSAQQGIRFNIFQLNQTYTGEDDRLNIGPKGFTGEKYGGSTYWDTEAYCLPYYLSTADSHVGQNLLKYRYNHLERAIENAEKLGFTKGAALYPMVTMNGEECHNEWEITFEEIHRNGAMAYAIYSYVRATGDRDYLATYGLEVLIGISRFWAQRFNWSEDKQKFVMLGVTGPNEYENNVNNNWYTSYLANWCMGYTTNVLDEVKEAYLEDFKRILSKTNFQEKEETEAWKKISIHTYYPFDEKRKVFLQQDGFLDKELIPADQLNPAQRPLVEHWSWDRILRSVYIKQADVLQGMYFFDEDFDRETIQRHFDFYEPFTVHESSLSPCVHSIIASRIGQWGQAYRFYLRTARLDLDDYNNDTRDGCHITSMAGTWLAVVQGFGGYAIHEHHISFHPFLPSDWKGYAFHMVYRGTRMKIEVTSNRVKISHQGGPSSKLFVYNHEFTLTENHPIEIPYEQ